jgi:hypothetical protein
MVPLIVCGPEPQPERQCECLTNHAVEPRPSRKPVPTSNGQIERSCFEAARWWTRIQHEDSRDDVVALCSHCLGRWMGDETVAVAVLGQVTGPFRASRWLCDPSTGS